MSSRFDMRSLAYKARDVLQGLPAVSPLTIRLALRRPSGLPIFLADTLRSYRTHAKLRIPAVTPQTLLDANGPVTIRVGENGVHFVSEPEMLVAQLAAMLRPKRCFEIGTYTGRVTSILAMNTPDDTKIFTLDLPPSEAQAPNGASDLHLIDQSRNELGLHFRSTPWFRTKINQLLGNSMTFDYAPYENSIDLVIVDASHTYEFVKSDSRNAFRMLAPNGVVLWHDYESARSEFGVTRFITELRERHGCAVYRLSTDLGDTRYAVMRVDGETKQRLVRAL